jgi:type IV secretion system protein VirB8
MLKAKLNKKSDKVDKKEWQQYLEETKGLERDYMAEIVKSRKVWQMLALFSFLFAWIAVLYHQFNPVTIKEPFVLRVDNATGAVDAVATIQEEEKTYGEVVDTYFIASFVKNYESYNNYSIQDDYDKTVLMSADPVAKRYMSIFDSTGGNVGRDAYLGTQGTREVNIISVVPNIDKGVATIRFETQETSSQGTQNESWVATLTYEYVAASIDADIRLLNPLGFVVTSYRVDKETF